MGVFLQFKVNGQWIVEVHLRTVCLFVCVFVCMHVHTHVHMCVYMCACTHMCATYVCMHVCVFVRVCDMCDCIVGEVGLPMPSKNMLADQNFPNRANNYCYD